jgi:hypothetical protein
MKMIRGGLRQLYGCRVGDSGICFGLASTSRIAS